MTPATLNSATPHPSLKRPAEVEDEDSKRQKLTVFPLLQLPVEMLEQVLCHLKVRDLLAVQACSRSVEQFVCESATVGLFKPNKRMSIPKMLSLHPALDDFKANTFSNIYLPGISLTQNKAEQMITISFSALWDLNIRLGQNKDAAAALLANAVWPDLQLCKPAVSALSLQCVKFTDGRPPMNPMTGPRSPMWIYQSDTMYPAVPELCPDYPWVVSRAGGVTLGALFDKMRELLGVVGTSWGRRTFDYKASPARSRWHFTWKLPEVEHGTCDEGLLCSGIVLDCADM